MKPPSRRALIVLSVAAAGVLVAGTAYAALPRTAAPALVTCMNTTTGAVRMVDTTRGQSCHPRRETPLPSGALGDPGAAAVPESAIRDAVDRAVDQAVAQALAGVPRGGTAGISSLDELEGLPCNVGTPDAGVVRIRYAPPRSGSTITMTCLSSATITTTPTPSPTTVETTTAPEPSPTELPPPPPGPDAGSWVPSVPPAPPIDGPSDGLLVGPPASADAGS